MKLFDLHCDTLYECYETNKALRQNDLAIDREKVADYAQYVQFFALFCGTEAPDYVKEHRRARPLLDLPPERRFDALRSIAHAQFADNADWLTLCTSAQDLDGAAREGKAAAFLSIEGAELLCGETTLERAYEQDVRLVTITWNNENDYGTPACIDQRAGLKPAGKQLVREMNALGVLPDVSHLSEAGFWDVAEHSTRPFVASHSNARAVCDHCRNLSDAQFDAIVRAHGLVGINLYGKFLTADGKSTVDDLVRHIEHFCARGGEKHLALGSDFDGCDILPDGIATARDLTLLAETLLRLGYKQTTVDDLFYGNASDFIHRNL